MVLQQLPQYLPSPLVHELLQLAGRKAGRSGPGELGGQPVEQGLRRGERIIRRDCAVRSHEGFFFLEVRME